MSRQKRTAPRAHRDPLLEPAQEVQAGADQEEELQVGNQAQQDRLDADVSMDVVRDSATPWVERALAALQLEALEPQVIGRFTEIVERSELPEERRAMLGARLRTDQAAAEGIGDVVQRWFQADGPELRDQLSDTLDQVLTHLREGSSGGSEWSLPGGQRVALSEAAQRGSVGARVEALVRDLAEEVAPPGVEGAAIQGFCREIQLALLWDEEEEEEGFGGDYAAEESGV